MKILIFLIITFVCTPLFLLSVEAKTVYIPEEISVEENAVKATTIRNMSEIEIYRCFPIDIIFDSVYILDMFSCKVVKLSLKGELLGRFGSKGQAPGEFLGLFGISKFNENIALTGKHKVIICDKDLKYLREIKLKERFHDLILATNNKIYFYNNPTYYNYYFTVYTDDFKYLKKFGIKNPNAKKKIITNSNYRYSSNIIRETLYVPEENGIWVSFRNRYDLRYYKNEELVVDIKSKNQIFAASEEEFMGKKFKMYTTDYAILIAKHEKQLYYCYIKGGNLYCDVFKFSENYHLYRRLKFPFLYKKLAHFIDINFYGLRYSEDKENVFLDKIQIH